MVGHTNHWDFAHPKCVNWAIAMAPFGEHVGRAGPTPGKFQQISQQWQWDWTYLFLEKIIGVI
jgi:hypothetical protein